MKIHLKNDKRLFSNSDDDMPAFCIFLLRYVRNEFLSNDIKFQWLKNNSNFRVAKFLKVILISNCVCKYY